MANIWKPSLQQYVMGLFKREQLKSFLDIGCGYGKDLKYFKEQFKSIPNCRFVGIDKLERAISSACENYSKDGLEFYTMDAADGLNFSEESFDIVYSMNVMECIKDKLKHIEEIHRVLKPGGQAVCCHCDWDSVIYNGENKEHIRAILNKYSNWKQPWMDDADSWMGRRLWGLFNSIEIFSGEVRIFNIIETDFSEHSKGWYMVKEIGYMVQAGVITKDEYDNFVCDIETASRSGEYLHVRPIYIYSGVKI